QRLRLGPDGAGRSRLDVGLLGEDDLGRPLRSGLEVDAWAGATLRAGQDLLSGFPQGARAVDSRAAQRTGAAIPSAHGTRVCRPVSYRRLCAARRRWQQASVGAYPVERGTLFSGQDTRPEGQKA